MVVLVIDGAHSFFEYQTSSNRMVIERAFGLLVPRWGIFWRLLEVHFHRRAPLIKCCIPLQNYCSSKRIALDLNELRGLTEIQPRRWEKNACSTRTGAPLIITSRPRRGHLRSRAEVGDPPSARR